MSAPDDLAERIEDEVAALVAAAADRVAADRTATQNDADASEPIDVPVVPRRRIEPPEHAPPIPHVVPAPIARPARDVALQHLAARRESER
jgi:hypothetical protein